MEKIKKECYLVNFRNEFIENETLVLFNSRKDYMDFLKLIEQPKFKNKIQILSVNVYSNLSTFTEVMDNLTSEIKPPTGMEFGA